MNAGPFSDWLFWCFATPPAILSLLAVWLTARAWDNGFAQGEKVISIAADAFRNPINSGITVAGLVLPIVAALIAFLAKGGKLEEPIYPILAAGLCTLWFSIVVGLYNNYSLATVTKQDGHIEITPDKNTYVPAVFVAQLVLLVGALLIVVLAVVFCPKPQNAKRPPVKAVHQYPILRPAIRVGAPEDVVYATWGTPQSKRVTNNTTEICYETENSHIVVRIANNLVVFIEEKTK